MKDMLGFDLLALRQVGFDESGVMAPTVRRKPPAAWWMSSRTFLVNSGLLGPQAARRVSMQGERLLVGQCLDENGDGHRVCQRLEHRQAELAGKGLIAAQHHGDHVERIDLEVRQEPHLGEDLVIQQVAFVNEKHRMNMGA